MSGLLLCRGRDNAPTTAATTYMKYLLLPGKKFALGGEVELLGRIKYNDGLDKCAARPRTHTRLCPARTHART